MKKPAWGRYYKFVGEGNQIEIGSVDVQSVTRCCDNHAVCTGVIRPVTDDRARCGNADYLQIFESGGVNEHGEGVSIEAAIDGAPHYDSIRDQVILRSVKP